MANIESYHDDIQLTYVIDWTFLLRPRVQKPSVIEIEMAKTLPISAFFAIFCIGIALAQDKCSVSDNDKVDCGISGTQQQECEANGCCWKPIQDNPTNLPW